MPEIRKVWYKKAADQKMLTVPKDSDIEPGDYVKIEKMELDENSDSSETDSTDTRVEESGAGATHEGGKSG